MNIPRIIQHNDLGVKRTMPEVLKLLNPQVKLQSPICNLTNKVKRFKGDSIFNRNILKDFYRYSIFHPVHNLATEQLVDALQNPPMNKIRSSRTKDEIYEELIKENEELDVLTEECLRVLCCSRAILLKWQLKDQLTGGKYYQPNDEIMEETASAPEENIISECDFAQLDRLLDKSPTTSTVAVSDIVCFINNKTPEYLDSIS